jgi:geranylgeranyl pyrophosphate synthase
VDVQAYLADCSGVLEPLLEASLPPADAPPERLHRAMRHLLLPGGKRLRPAFCLAACEAAGTPRERALPMAAAVELVHGFSLIHDDLPCMDDDRERRGRPAVHVAFGEDLAVLAGDALLALAFEVLAAGEDVDPSVRVACIRELARAAGSGCLVGGQVDDLHFDEARTAGRDEAARVEDVHARKSAALIEAAVVGGGLLGGASPDLVACLRRFSTEIGVAFQIADDLLDGDAAEACSLVRVLGPDGARARAAARLKAGLDELQGFCERAAPLRDLARLAVERDR